MNDTKILGPRKASEILLSGKDISAQEALSLGIVDEIVPAKQTQRARLKQSPGVCSTTTPLIIRDKTALKLFLERSAELPGI